MTTRPVAVGPTALGDQRFHLRVWAPQARRVEAVVDGTAMAMNNEPGGYWTVEVAAPSGTRYGFRLGDGTEVLPDPASHWQPDGVRALSALWDPSGHDWADRDWPGLELRGQVLYELHVGTFTRPGTWSAALAELPRLQALGVTVIQMMPIAAFAGKFGWGYDGVFWNAPFAGYGTPGDLQAFVDGAHALGLGVILDVVFNHLGPAGNVLAQYSPHYFSERHNNEWGDALNFDGSESHGLRTLVLTVVEHWIRDFHFDGFRLDAVQQIVDESGAHVLQVLTETARKAAAPRKVIVVAEHEPQHAHLMRSPVEGGYGLDGIFNDDLHHSWRVALSGTREAYLSDYSGTSREWLAGLRGFLYQGQRYTWQSANRGASALDRPPWQFIAFLENHDQVANLAGGLRLHAQTSPAWWRALSALLLLGPWTPLLFQGQEWRSLQPFRYFCDHDQPLQDAVARGRSEFVAQFTRARDQPRASLEIGSAAHEASILVSPASVEDTVEWRLFRDLLHLRAAVVTADAPPLASVPNDDSLLVRYETGADAWLVVTNLGPDLELATLADPLVASPHGTWSLRLCTHHPQYGGAGVASSLAPWGLMATGHATSVFYGEAHP
jgi:maltooligosyltrehalose trehalohydrolase